MSEAQLRTRLRRGEWQRPLPGVYADAGFLLSAEQWAFAAVAAVGGAGQPVPFSDPAADGSQRTRVVAAACGRTAARLGSAAHRRPRWSGTSGALSPRGPRLARCFSPSKPVRANHARYRPRHRTPALAGQRRPRQAALRAVGHKPPSNGRRLRHAADLRGRGLSRGRGPPPGVGEGRAAATGRRGQTRSSRRPPSALGSRGRRRSRRERRRDSGAAGVVARAPNPRATGALRDRYGRVVARVDLGDEQARFAVEIDGLRGHAGAAMVHKDRSRDRETASLGWWTERGSWFDVRRGQAAFRGRVLAAYTRLAARRTA